MTDYGGESDRGTIFELTPLGAFETLFSFDGSDGTYAQSTLIQRTDGLLYGTTYSGGAGGGGTFFSFDVGLRSFVETLPAAATVGSTVRILGTGLTNTTRVSFHAVATPFTVISSSELVTTVPLGATTGSVVVTTRDRTIASDISFYVLS